MSTTVSNTNSSAWVWDEEGLKEEATEAIKTSIEEYKPVLKNIIETVGVTFITGGTPIVGKIAKAVVTIYAPGAAPIVNPAIDISVGGVVVSGPTVLAPVFAISTEKTATMAQNGLISTAHQSIHIGMSLKEKVTSF